MKKRIAFIGIVGICLLLLLMMTGVAMAASGTCGDNLTWSLDSNSVLTISGTGAMYDYVSINSSGNKAPWGTGIKKVVIQNGVTTIGENAFDSCKQLTEVTFGEGVTRIKAYAFSYDTGLKSITLPSSLLQIDDKAFHWSGITSLTIPEKTTYFGENEMSSLEEIIVSTNNKYYSSEDGMLFDKEKTKLIFCPRRKTGSVSIPDGVEIISEKAFYFCSSLTGISIPDSVKVIDASAFNGCSSITELSLPSSLTSMKLYFTFSYCSKLRSIVIPKCVTEIGYSTFGNCSSLTSVTIPATVTSINDSAFVNCSGVKFFCHAGSAAEAFAIKNNFSYTSEAHSCIQHDMVAATCTTTGNITYWECTICGKCFSDAAAVTELARNSWVIPYTHQLTAHPAVNPTCTKTGTEAYWSCDLCKKLFSDADGKNGISAPVTVATTAHTLTAHNQVRATCTETGTEAYWSCSVCNKLFSDSKATQEIPAPTIIDKKPHSLSAHAKVDATCTATGTEAYWSCYNCNKLFSDAKGVNEIEKPVTIDLKAHTMTEHTGTAATCTTAGTETYWTCDVCRKMFSDAEGKTNISRPVSIPATGHDWTEPAYEWSEDNTQVTATRNCKNDEEHVETETVSVTYEITRKPTTEATGEIKYTSKSFKNEAFSVQTKSVELGRNKTLQLFDHVQVTVPDSFYLSPASGTPTYLDTLSTIAMSYRTMGAYDYQGLKKKLKSTFGSVSEIMLNGINMIGVAQVYTSYKNSAVAFIVDGQAVMIQFVLVNDRDGEISAEIMNSITVSDQPAWKKIIPEENSQFEIPGTFVYEGVSNELYSYHDTASGMNLAHIVIDDADTSYDTIKSFIGELAGFTTEKTNQHGYRIIAATSSSGGMYYFYAGYMSDTNEAVIIMMGYTVQGQLDTCDDIVETISAPSGFIQGDDGLWYYLLNGQMVVNGWIDDGGTWYYLGPTGAMVTGWLESGGDWYYFDDNGAMVTGWVQSGNDWYYMKSSGAMATGWIQSGNDWYYMKPSGAMATGWVQSGSDWYYMKPSGAMTTGWIQSGNDWYFMKSSGAMATGWLKDGGSWYYFKSSGAMKTGWVEVGGSWYYFKSSGAMKTGWLQLGSKWYWLDDSGAMATGWKEIDGQWEMFDDSGLWLYTWNE